MTEIKIRQVVAKDDIRDVMKSFYADENCLKSYPIEETEQHVHQEWFEKKIMPQGYSILAEDDDGICGVVIATHATADIEMENVDDLISLNSNVQYEFDNYLEEMMPGIVGNFDYLFVPIIVVKATHRRRKVAHRMMNKLEEKAGEENLKAIILTASSEISRKFFLSLHFQVQKEVVYADYIYPPTGKKEYEKLSGEHYRASIMMKRISKLS